MGGEDAKLELKIRVAACTQARIQALLCMKDAALRDSLIKGQDIIWLPQAGWPGMEARKWGGWWAVALQSEKMVTCGGVCGQTFSIEGPPGGRHGRCVHMRGGKRKWVCYECLGHRKRKLPPQDEDSDLDDHLGQADDDVQQQIQMGLVVRTADPTLLGVDGTQDTMLSCDALREYLKAMLVNYRECRERGDEWREDWVCTGSHRKR